MSEKCICDLDKFKQIALMIKTIEYDLIKLKKLAHGIIELYEEENE